MDNHFCSKDKCSCALTHKRPYEKEIFIKAVEDHYKELSGTKHDQGKIPLSLLPKEGLEYEAKAFDYGVKKYGKGNFRGGMEWSRLIDASLRHLIAFNNKEDLDKESGLHHLAHLKANVAMLIYYVENKVGKDDR